MRRLVERLRRPLLRRLGSSRASALDLVFAYRLLLGRAPDREGWRHYRREIRAGRLSLRGLADSLLGSEEFRSARAPFPDPDADYDSRPLEERTVSLPGLDIVVDVHDEVIGDAIAHRAYEPDVTRVLETLLAPGACFVDVGANVGWFTLHAARWVGPEGRVVAYEPMQANYRLLEKSIEANGLRNVELCRVALLDREGDVEFLQWERRNSGSFHVLNDPTWQRARYAAKACRFDDAFRGERLDVVKIDVEGAEGLVLAGMRDSLRRLRPAVIFEYSPSALADLSQMQPADLLAWLDAEGYDVFATADWPDGARRVDVARLARRLAASQATHVDLLALPRGDARRRRATEPGGRVGLRA